MNVDWNISLIELYNMPPLLWSISNMPLVIANNYLTISTCKHFYQCYPQVSVLQSHCSRSLLFLSLDHILGLKLLETHVDNWDNDYVNCNHWKWMLPFQNHQGQILFCFYVMYFWFIPSSTEDGHLYEIHILLYY